MLLQAGKVEELCVIFLTPPDKESDVFCGWVEFHPLFYVLSFSKGHFFPHISKIKGCTGFSQLQCTDETIAFKCSIFLIHLKKFLVAFKLSWESKD